MLNQRKKTAAIRAQWAAFLEDLSPLDAEVELLDSLDARRRVVPFRNRIAELARLRKWLDDRTAHPVLIVAGPAGTGKSRLAVEFARQLPPEMIRGWLHPDPAVTAALPPAPATPALILAEEADHHPAAAALLRVLAARPGQETARVVLITREAEGLRRGLGEQLGEEGKWIIQQAPVVEAAPMGEDSDRRRWFGEAVAAYASHHGRPVPGIPDDSPGDWAEPQQELVILHARALLAAVSDGSDPRAWSLDRVAAELMRLEQRQWQAGVLGTDWGDGAAPDPQAITQLVAVLALTGPVGRAEITGLVPLVPGLAPLPPERVSQVTDWVVTAFPRSRGAQFRLDPEIAGHWLIVTELADAPDLVQALRSGLDDERAARALRVIAQAAAHFAGPAISSRSWPTVAPGESLQQS